MFTFIIMAILFYVFKKIHPEAMEAVISTRENFSILADKMTQLK